MNRSGFLCKAMTEHGCDHYENCHHCHIKGRCSFCRYKGTGKCINCKVAPVQRKGENHGKEQGKEADIGTEEIHSQCRTDSQELAGTA